MRDEFTGLVRELQKEICSLLEEVDGKAKFRDDHWDRPEGGGGLTRVISGGDIFEKGGVNTSAVWGPLTPAIKAQLKNEGETFYATGVSLVIHPRSPMVPTVHGNFRYFELYDESGAVVDSWFGGGGDLTPYYLFEEDVVHFHLAFQRTCNDLGPDAYPVFKKNCDEYFVNHHRNGERRGVGGIFYDHQRPGQPYSGEQWINFTQKCALEFIRSYIEIVHRRKELKYTENERHWQCIRRGRYVEFNLIHDRGTLFGLKSNGRTESILMSLPPEVRFEYDYQPEKGSREEQLMQVLLEPREWL